MRNLREVICILITIFICINLNGCYEINKTKALEINNETDVEFKMLDYQINTINKGISKVYYSIMDDSSSSYENGKFNWLYGNKDKIISLNKVSDKSYSIRIINYKTNEINELTTLGGDSEDITSVSIQPKGQYIAYYTKSKDAKQLIIKDLLTLKDTVIDNLKEEDILAINWSIDSNYISYIKYNNSSNYKTIEIYNLESKKSIILEEEKLDLNNYNNYKLNIFNTSNCVVLQQMLDQKVFTQYIKDKNKVSLDINEELQQLSMYDKNNYIYLINGNIYNNKKIVCVMEENQSKKLKNIASFTISSDGNTIIYVKKSENESYDVYIGYLRNEVIVKQQLLYKDIQQGSNICFDEKENRVLINDGNLFISNINNERKVVMNDVYIVIQIN